MTAFTLCYHALDSDACRSDVGSHADLSVVVKAECFRRQLRCLSEMNLPVVSLAEQLSAETQRGSKKCVVLTFDDGHRSNHTLALPELLEAGATATFYVVAGFVENNAHYLTRTQLRELADSGMSIGSHTMTHRWLPQLRSDEIRRELADSKACLEDMLGQPVVDFALPGGHGNRAILDVAKACGYRSVATCKVGLFLPGGDPFHIPRLEIRRGLTIHGFRNTFRESTVLRLQMLEGIKAGLRKCVGLSMYGRLRRLAHALLTLNR